MLELLLLLHLHFTTMNKKQNSNNYHNYVLAIKREMINHSLLE